MFRDLKEYQEIAKIYADKVSKPEDLEERVKGGGVATNPVKPFEKPAPQVSGQRDNRPEVKGGITFKKPSVQGAQGRTKRPEPEKPMPTTAEIRAKNPNVVPGTRTNEIGAKGGGKPSSGDLSMFKDKKPEVSTMTKQGKPRTKAQMMAAKRIADGKSISDVKAANTASMKAKASERNQKFQDAKKSGNLAQFRKDNPKMSGADRAKAMAKARLAKKAAMENYTPYDIVLEYLLSSEQVATIEEANYVMTEMDAETIQGIVEMQGQINRADIIGGTKAAKNAAKGIGKYTPGKGVTKDFKLDPNFKLPGV